MNGIESKLCVNGRVFFLFHGDERRERERESERVSWRGGERERERVSLRGRR